MVLIEGWLGPFSNLLKFLTLACIWLIHASLYVWTQSTICRDLQIKYQGTGVLKNGVDWSITFPVNELQSWNCFKATLGTLLISNKTNSGSKWNCYQAFYVLLYSLPFRDSPCNDSFKIFWQVLHFGYVAFGQHPH